MQNAQPRQDLKAISTPELHDLMIATLKGILAQLKTDKDINHLRELRDYLNLLSSELDQRQQKGQSEY